ncbi:FMN-binding protein [Candidatus Riflebacteria bacterium]
MHETDLLTVETGSETRQSGFFLLPGFFLIGCFAHLLQIISSREMLAVFYGNEVSLGLFYCCWLLWISMGSVLISYLSVNLPQTPFLFLFALFLFPFAAIFQLFLFSGCRYFIEVSPSQLVPLGQMALATLLCTFPGGFLIGAIFPLGCHSLKTESNAVSGYIWEAWGSLLGGILFTFLLINRFSHFQTLVLASGTMGLFLLLISLIQKKEPEKFNNTGFKIIFLPGLFLLIAAICLFTGTYGKNVEEYLSNLRWNSILPDLKHLQTFQTPYQRIEIARHGKQISIIGNGKIINSFPRSRELANVVAFIWSQNPESKRILVFNGIYGGIIPELLKYDPAKIENICRDKKAFEKIINFFPEDWKLAFQDKRVENIFSDSRFFVNRRGSLKKYDLVICMPGDPSTASLNRLYTREFYRKIRALLNPNGVFITRITAASNYLGKEVKSYNASIFRTLNSVFNQVRVTPGDLQYFLASENDKQISLNPNVLAERFRNLKQRNTRVDERLFFSLLQKKRIQFVEKNLKEQQGELNTDLKPITYYFNMLLWGKFSSSRLVNLLEFIRKIGSKFFLIPFATFIFLFLLYSFRENNPVEEGRNNAILVTATLGFSAMTLELLLIFSFQNIFGYIFEKIGLLTGLFMFGLAMGALLLQKSKLCSRKNVELWLIFLLLACFSLAIQLPRLLEYSTFLDFIRLEFLFFFLVFCSGFIIGAAFVPGLALYNLHLKELGLGRSAGMIDFADHAGAAFGAAISGACLVPLLGISGTCELLSILLLLSCLPLIKVIIQRMFQSTFIFSGIIDTSGRRFAERNEQSLPYKIPGYILTWLCICFFIFGPLLQQAKDKFYQVEFSNSYLKEFTGKDDFIFNKNPFPHYLNFSIEKSARIFVFSSYPLSEDIRGYGGPINLLLSLSNEGELEGIDLIYSEETPGFIEGIAGWLSKFKGINLDKNLQLGKDIDGMSGSTVTSRAIVDIINRSSARAFPELLKIKKDVVKESLWQKALAEKEFFPILLFLLFFFPIYFSGRQGLRLLYLCASILIMGVFFNQLFTLIDVANISKGVFPWTQNWTRCLLLIFILITSIFWGQVFCGFVCPFGAVQEILCCCGEKLDFKSHPGAWLENRAFYLKFGLLAIPLSLYWGTGSKGWLTFNPMQHFFAWHFQGIMTILTLVVLLFSLFYFRFWCRFFCPAGALLSLFNKFAILEFLTPKREYKVCDLRAITKYDLNCIRCNRCVNRLTTTPGKENEI